MMGRGCAVDDREAAQALEGAMRRCRTRSIASAINRNRRLAWRLPDSNATPAHDPTAS